MSTEHGHHLRVRFSKWVLPLNCAHSYDAFTMTSERQSHPLGSLFRPIPGYSVAILRIVMGVLLLFESVNYGIFHCLDCLYRSTEYLFKYPYFDWVALPPGRGLEMLFFVMGVASVGVILGFWYRVSIIVLTVCFTWYFLIDASEYLNHFYLTILFLCILCVIPANRVWSLDAKRNGYSPYIGNWSRLLLILQLEIVLIYAGVVKLNADWLQLEPLRLWMTSYAVNAGPFMQWLTQDVGIALGAYGAIALHIIGAPLLLFQKTRLPVFCCYLIFHAINATVFNIGIFPFMTAAATTLLFAPDWPLNLWQKFKQKISHSKEQTLTQESPPVMGHAASSSVLSLADTVQHNGLRALIVKFFTLWLLVQVIVPTRPLWYAGPVAWNEAGHRFSWRMKLRDKRGKTSFLLRNEKTNTLKVMNPEKFLTPRQSIKMTCQPDLIWQFAQFLENKELNADASGSLDATDIKIVASAYCSLNTRKAVSLLKPVDLTSIARSTPREEWVTELTEVLPKR